MNKLLKVDLFRLRKDRTLLIGAIIVGILLILSIAGYFALKFLSVATDAYELGMIINPRTTYVQGFQMGSNAGLITMIIVAVFTSRDFTQNTLRLKILNGYDRTKIYLSKLFTNLIYSITIVFGYAVLVYALSSLIFGTSQEVNSKMILDFLGITFIGILHIILFVSIATAIAFKTQKIGSSVGFTIGFVIIESIVSSLIFMTAVFGNYPEWFQKFINIFPSLAISEITLSTELGPTAWIMILSTTLFIALTNFLGINSFRKSDIK